VILSLFGVRSSGKHSFTVKINERPDWKMIDFLSWNRVSPLVIEETVKIVSFPQRYVTLASFFLFSAENLFTLIQMGIFLIKTE
jgi:hypothetical protein